MMKTELFTRTGNVNDMIAFRNEAIATKLFKVDDKCSKLNDSTDIDKQDLLLIKSNVDDFLTVWARHARNGKNKESASYGVRIKTELAKRIPAIALMCGNMSTSFNDNSEYRIVCYSLDDVKLIISKILQYTQAYRLKQQTKEVVAPESVTA